jgi:NAD+ synthase
MESDKSLKEKIRINPELECRRIEKLIHEKMLDMGKKGVIIGLSGGIDSAVITSLVARAVGPEQVLCVFMPEKHTSRDSHKHAKLLAEQLGIGLEVHNITSKLNKFRFYRLTPGRGAIAIIRKILRTVVKSKEGTPFESGLGKSDNKFVALANSLYRIKPRMRMLVLYDLAERQDMLVVGGANKSEYAIGLYITQGCDDAADVMPIWHLYKTQVIQLAQYLDVPQAIVEKAPSPDFIPGMTDEGVIGITYKILDLILLGLELGYSTAQIVAEVGCVSEDVDYVIRLKKKSQHRRDIPYVI